MGANVMLCPGVWPESIDYLKNLAERYATGDAKEIERNLDRASPEDLQQVAGVVERLLRYEGDMSTLTGFASALRPEQAARLRAFIRAILPVEGR